MVDDYVGLLRIYTSEYDTILYYDPYRGNIHVPSGDGLTISIWDSNSLERIKDELKSFQSKYGIILGAKDPLLDEPTS